VGQGGQYEGQRFARACLTNADHVAAG
jgi:hypothetical protein